MDIPQVQQEEKSKPEPASLESPLPTVQQIEAEAVAREEKEFNTHTTKVPVSYPTTQVVDKTKIPEELVQSAAYGTEPEPEKLSRLNRTSQAVTAKKRQSKVAGKIVKTMQISNQVITIYKKVWLWIRLLKSYRKAERRLHKTLQWKN